MTRRELLTLGPALAMALVGGCKTLTREDGLAVFATLAGSAAYTGALYTLRNDPQSRTALVLAQLALAGLLNRQDYDVAKAAEAIRTLLDNLRTDALRGDTAALLVGESLLVFDVARQRLLDMARSPEWVQAVLSAVESGLRRALDQPPTRGAVKPVPNYPVPKPTTKS